MADPAELQADRIGAQIGDDLGRAQARAREGEISDVVRDVAQTHLGVDMRGTQLRTGSEARAVARRERALAVAEGSTVRFARGRLDMSTRRGRALLGHELVHVAQQRAAGVTRVQRNGDADDQLGADPCDVNVDLLTNQGLLTHLNSTRLFLHEHEPDDEGFYDWANLFRRLSAERRRRQRAGHVWLAERGLIAPPPNLYKIDGSNSAYITVETAVASDVAGRPEGSDSIYVSPGQFESFLRRNRVPQTRIADLLAGRGMAPGESTDVELSPYPRHETYRPMYYPAFQDPPAWAQGGTNPGLFGGPNAYGQGAFDHGFSGPLGTYLDDYLRPGGTSSGGPFGGAPFGVAPFGGQRSVDPLTQAFTPVYGPLQTTTHIPTANQALHRMTRFPGSYTADGPERIFLPQRSDGGAGSGGAGSGSYANWDPADPLGLNAYMGMDPANTLQGVSALGWSGQPRVNMPENATGIMWEGAHVTDFVVARGRMQTGGFRASLARHGASNVQRMMRRGGGSATASLNAGTPGTYANDALFPYMGAVAVYRADGTPATAQEVASMMADARGRFDGDTYRYSTPPRDHPAYDRAFGDQGPDFCPPGANNCINLPMDVHQQALGGDHLVLPQEDGTFISMADPAHASAQNMDRWVDLPDSFFTERGLVRVNLGANHWRGVGMGAAFGGLTSLASDAYTDATTDQNPRYVVNAGINIAAGGGSVVAENWAANALHPRFIAAGASPGTSAGLSRLAGGTGIAAVVAPAVTGATMYFDDNEYTNIDYAARMTRSGTSAIGGALAAGGYFALMGSEVPLAGNVAGFVIGFGGYYVTDWLTGDEVEEGVRGALGEQGCDD